MNSPAIGATNLNAPLVGDGVDTTVGEGSVMLFSLTAILAASTLSPVVLKQLD